MAEMTPTDASHVLGVMGEGGMTPGNFVTKLIEAMLVADMDNLRTLGFVFPGLAHAVSLYKFERNGVEMLRQVAAGTR